MSGMIEGIVQIGMGMAELSDTNGRIKEERATEDAYFKHMGADALQRGGVDAGHAREAGSELTAAEASAYTDSGVDAGVGTAAQVQANTQMKAALDAQTIKNNAAAEAWGFDQANKRSAREARAKENAATTKFTGTVLGGAGKFIGGAFGGGGGGMGG